MATCATENKIILQLNNIHKVQKEINCSNLHYLALSQCKYKCVSHTWFPVAGSD
jgi:hypothetical protein